MKTHPEEFSLHTRSWKLSTLNPGLLWCGHVPVDALARRRTATINCFPWYLIFQNVEMNDNRPAKWCLKVVMSKANISSKGLVFNEVLDELSLYISICLSNNCFSTSIHACAIVGDILPPVCYCCSVCERCTMAGKSRDFQGGGEVWKTACCIDCVRVVNGILLGSVVEVIKQEGCRLRSASHLLHADLLLWL